MTSVSVPSTSDGVAIRHDRRSGALLEERREQLVRRAERGRVVDDDRLPCAEEALTACDANGAGRPRIRSNASASLGSAMWSARGTSCSRRSSGVRITAASVPSSSTTVRATASNVASSERLCANEREIS